MGFGLGTNAQLRFIIQVLFDELKLDTQLPDKSKSIRRTVAGREKSTSEAVLKRLSAVHPLPALVLEYRQVLQQKAQLPLRQRAMRM